MTEISSEASKVISFAQKFWNSNEKKSLKRSAFEAYRRLYYEENYEEASIIRQKVKIGFEGIIWCIQIVSLLWIPKLSIKNWHTNKILWEIIGYLKFDNACSSLGIMNECLYLSMLIPYASLLCLLIFFTMIYYSYPLSKLILGIFKLTFYLWSVFFLIPTIQIFSIFIKYNFLSQSTVSEYENHNELDQFKISSAVQIGIIFALLISLFLIFFQTQFSGEIRHSVNKKTIDAKAHSKTNIHIAVFTYFFPIAYTVFAENCITYLQILAIIFAIFLLKETMIVLPYFSIFYNSIIILRFYIIAFISFIFLLGKLMDNSLAISILVVILGPLSTYFVIQFSLKLQKQHNKSIPQNLEGIKSQYNLEKSVRYALCSNDTEYKDEIIKIFETFFIEKGLNGNKLQAIWIANYCLFTLKDESLAKVKLSKAKHIPGWSFEALYQEYLCFINISNTCLSDGSLYSNYFLQFNIIRKEDEILCTNLLNFWAEITSSIPNLHKLQKHLNLIDDEILFLKKEYSDLTTKFPNSRESLSIYSSFVKDITCDSEKSLLLEVKLRALDRAFKNFCNDARVLNYFNDGNGILIISNEFQNFGEILFANQKSAEFLRLPINSIMSDNILNFIHPFYKEKFKIEAKRFVQFSSSSEIDLSQGFFLTVHTYNLLECIGKVVLTAINDVIVTILVFKPKISNYQVALISEEGEIICHSDNFPRIAKKSENLVGWRLKNLFFNSEDFDLQPNTTYNLSHFKNETFLILSHSEFYKMKIPYVMLMNNYEEVLKWSNENPQGNQGEIQVRNQLSINLLSSLCSDKSIPSFHKESQRSEEDLDSKMMLYPLSDKIGDESSSKRDSESKSQVSISSSQNRFLNMIKSSSRSINILHLAFVFSILTVLAVNVTVLIYAFYNINFISDMNLPIYIGKSGKNFQRMAYLSRMLFSLPNPGSDDPLFISMTQEYQKILLNLENIYWNITFDLNKWDSCSGKSILTDEVLNLWNVDENGIYKKKTTLVNTMGRFIKIGNRLFNNLNATETAQTDISFLLLNGYGDALNYCNSSLYDIMDCQKSMMSDFKTRMTIFLLLGIAILLVCILIIVPFYYSIFKIENNLWNNIRKNAHLRYFDMKQTIMERLRCVHSQPELALNDQHISMKPYRFKNYWKYIWRTLVYLAFSLLFSIINIAYLYEKCSEYLLYRPEVLKHLINSQILYTSLSISTTEVALASFGSPLIYQFPSTYPFTNTITYFLEVASKLEYSNSALRKNKYAAILSKSFKETLYEFDQQHQSEYFTFGIYPAKLNIINEAYLIAFSLATPEVWMNLMSALQELDLNYDTFIDEIEKYSQNVIDNQMVIIVVTLVIFIVFSFILYFGFYLIFFRREKKYLQKINSVMQIMPN